MANAFASISPTDVDQEEVISDSEVEVKSQKPMNMKDGAMKLRCWLNKSLRIKMSDGRILIGVFLCTDRDTNVILGSCTEYLPVDEDKSSESTAEEPRMLGLVMVPGKHISSVAIDQGPGPDLSVMLTGQKLSPCDGDDDDDVT